MVILVVCFKCFFFFNFNNWVDFVTNENSLYFNNEVFKIKMQYNLHYYFLILSTYQEVEIKISP